MAEPAEYLSVAAFGMRWDGRPRIIKAEALSAVEAAAALVAAAEAKAAGIVRDAERVHAERRRQGLEEGRAEAAREALARLAAETAALDAHYAAIEHDMGELLAGVMRRLAGEFTDEEKILVAVQGAFAKFRKTNSVRIGLHPDAMIHKARIEAMIREAAPSLQFLDIVEEPALAADAVLIEAPIGRVETSLSREIEAAAAALTGTNPVPATGEPASGGTATLDEDVRRHTPAPAPDRHEDDVNGMDGTR